jgi:hypothetical protein
MGIDWPGRRLPTPDKCPDTSSFAREVRSLTSLISNWWISVCLGISLFSFSLFIPDLEFKFERNHFRMPFAGRFAIHSLAADWTTRPAFSGLSSLILARYQSLHDTCVTEYVA